MAKRVALALILLLLLVGTAWASDYTVTGAGETDFNDTYTENGAYGGKPCYEGDTNGKWLYYGHYDTPGGDTWVLHATKTGMIGIAQWAYYYGSNGQATPPEGTYTDGTATGSSDAEVAVTAAGGVADKISSRANARMVFTGCNPRMMF